MKFRVHAVLGNLMAGAGLAIFVWTLFFAETRDHGLGRGVNAFGISVPAMMPILAALGLVVISGTISAIKIRIRRV